MDEPLDLSKKRVIPTVTYSVVENLGWDSKDKKQRKVGEITQTEFIDLRTSSNKSIIDSHELVRGLDNKINEIKIMMERIEYSGEVTYGEPHHIGRKQKQINVSLRKKNEEEE
jgi:hypothetical protein